ncbi:MAG: hypothetical protein IKV98_03465 [Clostridia bacterium]|nr:hypothetical protein [Clostridia bacterium]
MKKQSKMLGLAIMAAGATVLVSCFMPKGLLVLILAALLILVGFLYLTA